MLVSLSRFTHVYFSLFFSPCKIRAEDRVDVMERSPNISWLFHVRLLSLLTLLSLADARGVAMAYDSTLTKGASVQLVFGFEYAILLVSVLNVVTKYALHEIDYLRANLATNRDNGQGAGNRNWEDKAVYLLYSELILSAIKVILYMTFISLMMKIHTFPLFAIRPTYLSVRSFKKALNDVIQSRRAIENMNSLYPNATAQDLQEADNICIICREEMVGTQTVNGTVINPASGLSKKLPCGHIFHVSCLRSWFQRQQTCPTCRLDVLRAGVAARSYGNNNNNNNNNVNNANVMPVNQPAVQNPVLQQQQQHLFHQMFLTHLMMNAQLNLNANLDAAARVNPPAPGEGPNANNSNTQAPASPATAAAASSSSATGSGRNITSNNTSTSSPAAQSQPQASTSTQHSSGATASASTPSTSQSSSSTQSTGASSSSANNTGSSSQESQSQQQSSSAPTGIAGLPPFPAFLPSITSLPVAPSSLDLSRLSDRELALLVRREREGLEARLNLYAQSRILIDAAITNLLQFNSALAFANVDRRNSTAPVDEFTAPVNLPSDLIEENESNENPTSTSGRILSEEELFRRRTHSDVRRVRVSRFSGRSEATSLPSHDQTDSSGKDEASNSNSSSQDTTGEATSGASTSSNKK